MRTSLAVALSAALLLARPAWAVAAADDHAGIAEVARVPVSLPQAITIAEAMSHANAVGARFAAAPGKPVYDIDTFANGVMWQGRIDATTGRLLGTPVTTPGTGLGAAEAARLMWLQDTASVPLRRAVEIAERQSGGKAIASTLTSAAGKLAYTTKVVTGDRVETLRIDPQNGRVLANRATPFDGASAG
ncbi:MAG TPA: PepSY domain-containing protein [Stellaceae bacterium]|nr:PepSY domain-containing protein [Stellaceae bacterium]